MIDLKTNKGIATYIYFVANMGAGNDTTAPSFVSAEVGSVADNILRLVYDETLNPSVIPATTDYTVNDGAANAVTNVSVSGLVVSLTLTNTVHIGDTVVVSYTAGANPLQDLAANNAANLTTESVTNNSSTAAAGASVITTKSGDTITTKDGDSITTKN